MGETRADPLHRLEDLEGSRPGAIEETILTGRGAGVACPEVPLRRE